mgnify:CR=1 FL=1
MTKPLIALYQPDIPGNTGSILRLGACLGLGIHIIGPAGFDMTDRALKRAGMDYIEMAALTRHDGWEEFEIWRTTQKRRLVLMTTQPATPYNRPGRGAVRQGKRRRAAQSPRCRRRTPDHSHGRWPAQPQPRHERGNHRRRDHPPLWAVAQRQLSHSSQPRTRCRSRHRNRSGGRVHNRHGCGSGTPAS